MKTKTITLESLIKSNNFTYVNSNITPDNFPPEKIRSTDFKLFHFNKLISSEDAVKEIELAGYLPANIYELLSWPDWNGKDWVVGLGPSCVVDGYRYVPYLSGWGPKRNLFLDWFGHGWRDGFRFLAVRNSDAKTLETRDEVLGDLETLNLDSAIKIVKEAGYVIYKPL